MLFTISGVRHVLSRKRALGTLAISCCASLTMIGVTWASSASDSLTAYWKLDEGSGSSGSTVIDSSGDGNAGMFTGTGSLYTATTPTMTFNDPYAMQFNGSNDVVTKLNPSGFNTGTNPRSLSVWVYPLAHSNVTVPAAYGICAAAGGGHDGQSFGFYLDASNDVHFWGCGSADFDTSTVISTGSWTHIAVTYDGTNVKVYKNGTQIGSTTARTLVAPTATTYFQVGGVPNIDSSSHYFNGYIDDVRIYNRTLTTAQVTQLAAGGDPSAYWNGASDTSFENKANWSGSYIPDAYSRIVVQDAANPLSLTGTLKIAGITVDTGALIDLDGNTVDMKDNGSIVNEGTIGMHNTETLSGVTIPTTQGTIMIDGTGSSVGFVAGNTFHNLTLNDGLITYLKFDEASGTRATDSSGYGNSGSLVNNPTISTTVAPVHFQDAHSLAFNGTDQYVALPSVPVPLIGSGSKTISLWAYPTRASNSYFYIGPSGGGSQGQSLRIETDNSGYLELDISSGVQTSTLAITQNAWQLISVIWDASARRWSICRNATCQTLSSLPESRLAAGFFLVGYNQTSSQYMQGNIDDVRVYDRALTAIELGGLAAGNQPATASGSVTLNHALTVNGNLTLNGKTLDASSLNYGITVDGDWVNNGGSFDARRGAVTLHGNTGLNILTGGQPFNDLTFNDTGTRTQDDPLVVSGSLAIDAGTLDDAGSYTIHTSSWLQPAGIFTPHSGTVVLTNVSDSTFAPSSAFHVLRVEEPDESGLIGYWKMDEGNGSSVHDVSGHGHSGARTGTGATYTGATLPSLTFDDAFAMQFNGQNDAVTVPASSALTPSAITVSAWIRPASQPATNVAYSIVDKRDDTSGTAGYVLEYVNSLGVSYVAWYSAHQYNAYSTVLPLNSWTHVALTQQGTTSIIYINGVAVSTATNTTALTDYSKALEIGAGNGYFNGAIDDVRLYDHVLDSKDIENLARGQYAHGGSGTSTVTLGGDVSTDYLALDSGNLNTGSHDLTVTNNVTQLPGRGALTLGSSATTVGGLTMSGSSVTGSSGTLTVNGTVSMLTGSLVAPSGTMNVSGNWNTTGGMFDTASGTVDFNGTDQSILSDAAFYNLTKSVSTADTLTFAAGKTVTVNGTLTLAGAAGHLLSIVSSSNGAQWLIDPKGTRAVLYLSVKDSDNVDATAIDCLSGCSDAGDNTNWTFPSASTTTTTSDGGGQSGGYRGQGTDLAAALQNYDSGRTDPPASGGSALHSSASGSSLFSDVALSSWYATAVDQLARLGIIGGYKDAAGHATGRYGPGDAVTYAQFAKMLLRTASIRSGSGDLPPTLAWPADYLRIAQSRGMTVYENLSNRHAPMTRGAVAQSVVDLLHLSKGTAPVPVFIDLPATHAHASSIDILVSFGLMTGDAGKTTIRPDAPLNRAEAAVLLSRLLALPIESFAPSTSVSASSASSASSMSSSSALQIENLRTANTNPNPNPNPILATVTSFQLHLRMDARVDSLLLQTLKQGATVTVLYTLQNGWAYVKTADGTEGYVYAQFLAL